MQRKTSLNFKLEKPTCPQCKSKLAENNFQIVFKDVLECFSCGKIWVSFKLDFFLKNPGITKVC